MLAVEVNFTDDRDKHLLNEHSIPDSPTKYRPHLYPLSLGLLLQLFDECVCLKNTFFFYRDFSVPTNIHEKVQAFENSYESKPVQYVYDQITENLFS